jgi:uncharacterized protein
MKFTLSAGGAGNLFSAYGDGWVEVNGVRHATSLLVPVDHAVAPWVIGFEQLDEAAFRSLLDWEPEIVVFGSGGSFRFPHPRLTQSLATARIGLEVMDSHAACRTFNVLAGEGRKVLAAILL